MIQAVLAAEAVEEQEAIEVLICWKQTRATIHKERILQGPPPGPKLKNLEARVRDAFAVGPWRRTGTALSSTRFPSCLVDGNIPPRTALHDLTDAVVRLLFGVPLIQYFVDCLFFPMFFQPCHVHLVKCPERSSIQQIVLHGLKWLDAARRIHSKCSAALPFCTTVCTWRAVFP